MNAGTSPLGILAQYVRGAQQEIGHPHRAQMININQRHWATTAATKNRPLPVSV